MERMRREAGNDRREVNEMEGRKEEEKKSEEKR